MRQPANKIFILLQLCLYLLGGHATAHGLDWCLSTDGHAHVATAAGCVTEQEGLSCSTAGSCTSFFDESTPASPRGTECRHLPVTSPHTTGATLSQKTEPGVVVALIQISPDFTLSDWSFVHSRQALFPAAVELPRPEALLSLRTIVLLI